jgi:hypothetical protein
LAQEFEIAREQRAEAAWSSWLTRVFGDDGNGSG